MKQIYLGLAIHNHQPVDNFGSVFEQVYRLAYLPFVEALERHPGVRLSLHYSGCLLDWLLEHRRGFLERLAALAARGQIEVMTGGYYEPILPIIPDSDKLEQIAKLSAAIKDLFGQEPTGLWLTERVWEPHLPKPLAQAGVKWTVVDDTHFQITGLRDQDLFGYYMTEEEGLPLKVFSSSKHLRYIIPWRSVAEVIDYLRQEATEGGNKIAVMGDDGEKFGSWPKTYMHCWEKGWMEDFLVALEENSQWLKTIPLGEYAAQFPPLGLAYLPTASYAELMEWALPTPTRSEFSHLLHEMEAEGRQDILGYLRGGFWRNFLSKYPEANNMHKKMLHTHRKVQRARAAHQGDAGLDDLWKGQCNCAYWHGVFGGLYLNYMRHGVYRHLIEAEVKADTALRQGSRLVWEKTDFDGDGRDELLVEGESQNLYFHLGEGGCLFEWDLRGRGHNLGATLTRRPEAYHQDLLQALAEKEAEPSEGVKTIHQLVHSKEKGLERYLNYDWYRRASLIDHFLGEGTDLEGFSRCVYDEAGDFVNQPYQAIAEPLGQGLRVHLWREGHIWYQQRSLPLRVEKEIHLTGDSNGFALRYRLTNASDSAIHCRFGSEWNLALSRAGSEKYDRWQDLGTEWQPLEPRAEKPGVMMLSLKDRDLDLSLSLESDRPAALWSFPVETVSSSEDGFERTFQGRCLLLSWDLELKPGEAQEIGLQWHIASP